MRLEPLIACGAAIIACGYSLPHVYLQVRLTTEFRKQIVRLKKGLPGASPMKSPAAVLTTPPKGSAHGAQPQIAPGALKVAGAPGTPAVAQLVENGPLAPSGATARPARPPRKGSGLLYAHPEERPSRAGRQERLRHHR
jgi:hypothetical protein|tara:strand:+ start:918 stop:1334 length:417 start_codon:yes stop_codon:yes gene_type:complete